MAKLEIKRQEMFCRHYITEIDGEKFNATKTAIKAGYAKKGATQTASRLLTYVHIQQRIAELQEESFKRCELDADYVLNKFKKIAEDDIRNYLSFGSKEIFFKDDEGNQDFYNKINIVLKDSETIDTWNVSEITLGKDGQFKFKLHDKSDALVNLGRHLKLFTDKIKIEEDSEINVVFKNMDRPKIEE